MRENEKYEEAVGRLEKIVADMESGQPDIDQLSSLLGEAQRLIALCRDRLTRADAEIEKILSRADGE